MNAQEQYELLNLKRQQQRLKQEVEIFGAKLQRLEDRLRQADALSPEAMEISPMEIKPLDLAQEPAQPPTLSPKKPTPWQPPPIPVATPPLTSQPPVLPPVIQPVMEPFGSSLPAFQESSPTLPPEIGSGEPAYPAAMNADPPPPIEPPPLEAPEPRKEGSFEMQLGTYWLVRIGIVMLLTSLVFFGNYAFHHFVGKLGAVGKLGLLYLAGGALLGAGSWLQRKQESLRNYGQVLFAGGLAAIYFTTYAAHYLPQVRVIENPVMAGFLLLGWAGFMVWLADRKKSELLAMFSIGLAYYTSAITPAGGFTLYSNFLLNLSAVYFLIRNRWATLSFASLVATYAAYAYWHFFYRTAGFWPENLFLLGYWATFTFAVFWSTAETFTGPTRATFLSGNNAAFFGFVTLNLVPEYRQHFWVFALGYGAVLVGLAPLAKRMLPGEPMLGNTYLTQGLLLTTMGLIAKFSGLQLGLLLAGQSVALLVLGGQLNNRVLRVGSYVSAGLAVAWGAGNMQAFDRPGLYLAIAMGALLGFNAIWANREAPEEDSEPVRGESAFFSALALFIWFLATWNNVPRSELPLFLAAEAALFTASIYVVKVREITLFGQGFLIIAQAVWLSSVVRGQPMPPWWNPALMIGVTLGLSHWWQWQKVIPMEKAASLFVQSLLAVALVAIGYTWLEPHYSPATWMAVTSFLSIGLAVYGVFTRSWLLVPAGQLFLLASLWMWARQMQLSPPSWVFALAPIMTLVLCSFGASVWRERNSAVGEGTNEALQVFIRGYRWLAVGLALVWVNEYIPAREQFWFLALLGGLAFAWSGWRSNAEISYLSATLTAVGFWHFWAAGRGESTVYWPNALAILFLLGQQQVARRFPERYDFQPGVHWAMILVGGLSAWLLVTRWVLQSSGGIYLTVSWSALALPVFAAGLWLKERMHRWLGLAFLGCALGRVVLLDVWRLEPLYRIFSFMALGVVLLVLGFIYNKYQDKIRGWL